jgi:diguanylate cyclase (GGDEF)-like protein
MLRAIASRSREAAIHAVRHLAGLLFAILLGVGVSDASAGERLRFVLVGQGSVVDDPRHLDDPGPDVESSAVARDLGGGTWWRSTLPVDDAAGSPAAQPRVLHFRSGFRAELTILIPDTGDRISRTRRGEAGPSWGLREDLPVTLPSRLSPGSVIYLHVDDARGREVHAIVSALDDYAGRAVTRKIVVATSITALVTLALIAILLWRGFGGVSYAHLAASAFLMAGYTLTISGEVHQFIDSRLLLTWTLPLQRTFATLAVAFSHLFIISYLELARRRPIARRLLLILASLQAAIAAIGWIEGPVPDTLGSLVSNLLILASIPLVLFEAWLAHRDRMKAGRYVLWAWGPALALLGLWIFALQGWLPAAWLDIGSLVFYGLAAQVAVLLLGLADDTARLRKERDTATVEAGRDPLTGVLNRRALQQRLQRLLPELQRLGRPLSVVFLDIDHFKRINDQFGHAAGDLCLRELVDRCQAVLGTHDVLARYGGEEFVLLLPGRGADAATAVAERLRALIAEPPFVVEGRAIDVRASLGISEWREGEDIGSLLARADEALYRAKRAGRNRTVRWQPVPAPGT